MLTSVHARVKAAIQKSPRISNTLLARRYNCNPQLIESARQEYYRERIPKTREKPPATLRDKIQAALEQDPALSVTTLAQALGCHRVYAAAVKRNFGRPNKPTQIPKGVTTRFALVIWHLQQLEDPSDRELKILEQYRDRELRKMHRGYTEVERRRRSSSLIEDMYREAQHVEIQTVTTEEIFGPGAFRMRNSDGFA